MSYETVFETNAILMTNDDGSYGVDTAVKFSQNLLFPYNLKQGDWFTGSVQFMRIVRLILDPDSPGTKLGFAESNPRRYFYGEWSLTGADGYVHERGAIDSTFFCLRRLSEPYPLSRNEAARPKLLVLKERLRATFQNTFLNLPQLQGKVTPVDTALSGFTNLVAPPNSGTTNGTISPGSNSSTPSLNIEAGTLKFHTTDSNVQMMAVSPTTAYQPLENLFGNHPDIQPAFFNVYLNPGVIGSCEYVVLRCGDQQPTHPNVGTPYLPSGLP